MPQCMYGGRMYIYKRTRSEFLNPIKHYIKYLTLIRDSSAGLTIYEVNVKILRSKGPFTQAIFAAIFLLLMHAMEWID